MVQSQIEDLVNRYFGQIEVEGTDFEPRDDAGPDAAYLLLRVPLDMLRSYMVLKSKDGLPGAEFWKETKLRDKLRNSGKYHGQGCVPLEDVLDFLGGNVQVTYQELKGSPEIRMSITEIFPRSED